MTKFFAAVIATPLVFIAYLLSGIALLFSSAGIWLLRSTGWEEK